MANADRQSVLSYPLRWFPEFLEFGKRRFRTEGRVLSAAILIGIVAGLGGVVFTLASQGRAFRSRGHRRLPSPGAGKRIALLLDSG
jgi:hypothetical protein